MDPPEQALVEVGAATLAAPSAAVAGLVAASIADNTKRTYAAALKRLDAGLRGRTSPTPGSRGRTSPTPAWPSTLRACTPPGSRRPSPQWRPGPGRRDALQRSRHRGRGRRQRRRGLDCRDADGGQVAVTGDAGPLCTGPVDSTGRRRSRTLQSRIKPGVDHTTIFPAEGG